MNNRLYKPFQSNYAGDNILCQITENKKFAKLLPSGPLAGGWTPKRRTIAKIAEALIKLE